MFFLEQAEVFWKFGPHLFSLLLWFIPVILVVMLNCHGTGVWGLSFSMQIGL
jgi:hypothetical protein